MAVKAIPEGHGCVSPYLIVDGAAKVIDLLTRAFDAQEVHRMTRPDGTILHAQVRIGDSVVMLSDATPEFGPMPAMIHVYVNDADAVYRRAVGAGAVSLREPADEFYGDRAAGVQDAAGNHWWIATHKEDVPPAELARRAEAAMKQPG